MIRTGDTVAFLSTNSRLTGVKTPELPLEDVLPILRMFATGPLPVP